MMSRIGGHAVTRIAQVIGLAVMAFAVVGCGTTVTSVDLLGDWGGQHISLRVAADSSVVEYDCAHGTIDEPLVIRDNGRFDARGTHVMERGGPIMPGQTLETHPARYVGTVDGTDMTISVTLLDTGMNFGLFTATLGAPPRLFKCL